MEQYLKRQTTDLLMKNTKLISGVKCNKTPKTQEEYQTVSEAKSRIEEERMLREYTEIVLKLSQMNVQNIIQHYFTEINQNNGFQDIAATVPGEAEITEKVMNKAFKKARTTCTRKHKNRTVEL